MNINVSDIKTDYAYALGLVSGLYGRMLKPRDFESMAQAAGVREVLSALEGTAYGEGLRRLKEGYGLRDMEGALASQFRKSYVEVASAVPESDRDALDSLVLGGWDLDNIKTVARALRSGAGAEESRGALFPHGRLGMERLSAVAASTSLEEMAGRLPEPYSLYVSKALPKKQNQLEFEEELDRSFIIDLLAQSREELRDYLGLSVDILNVRAILRCRTHGIEPDKHVIREGFHITPNRLSQLMRQDLQGVIKLLEDTPYSQAVKDAVREGAVDLGVLDAGLRKALAAEVEYNATLRPLSVNSVIAYVRRREDEARNVRAMLAGKWYGLGAEELKRLVS